MPPEFLMPEGTIFSKRCSDVWVHIYHCDPYTGFLNRPLGRISKGFPGSKSPEHTLDLSLCFRFQ